MYWAILDDGRRVIVTNGKTRKVNGKEHFLLQEYAEVLLDGGIQVVRKDRLKPAQYGSPFEVLK